MTSKPKCERCQDTAFMSANSPLCTDCARWFKSLGHDARAHDHEAWGAGPSRRKAKPPKPEKDPLERYGFTPLKDMNLP